MQPLDITGVTYVCRPCVVLWTLVVDVVLVPRCRSVVLVVESLSLEGGLCVLCNMGWSGFAMQALQRLVSM